MILIAQRVDKPHYNDVIVIYIQPHEQAETIISDSQRIRLISSHYWIRDDENTMRLIWADIDYKLYFKIREIGIGMGNLIELASGVTAYGDSGHSSSKGRIYHSSHKQSDEWIPFFTGSCRRYSIEQGIEEYIHYAVHLVSYPERRFLHANCLYV